MSTARWARIGFALLAWLFVGLTGVQVYLAGAAVQQLGGSNDFGTHQAMGFVIMLIALIQLVLSFAGRMPLRMIGASALAFALMIVQSALVHIGTPSLAALHPVNGFLVGLLALWIAWRSLGYVRAPLPPEPVRPIPVPATPAASPSGKPDTEVES